MAIANVEQVRAVAAYAEYAGNEAVTNKHHFPQSFDQWVFETYGCNFEDLGAA